MQEHIIQKKISRKTTTEILKLR